MELLAEFKGDCDGLFLKLDKQSQADIPYDKTDQGYKAYWGKSKNDAEGDDDDENSDPDAYFYFQMTYTITGQQGETNTKTETFISESSMQLPFGAYSANHMIFGTARGAGNSFPIAGPSSPYYSLGGGSYGFLEGNLEYSPGGISAIPSNGGAPLPLDPDGNPIKNKKEKVVVKRLNPEGGEDEVKTIDRDTKPTDAVFICEDCEEHCVLMVRKKTDKFAVGICICNSEEDYVAMKAQIKAELVNELPPMIQDRIKAQNLPTLKTEVTNTVREGFTTDVNAAREQIATDIKGDTEFSQSLAEKVKQDLMEDVEFNTHISSICYAAMREEVWKTEYFVFLDGNELATRLIAGLSDATKLAALKTKLGIVPVAPTPSPSPTPSDPNKLTANGYEWTIGKDMGGVEVVSVSRTALTGDNLSTLTNSASAIVTALLAKFPGKNFSVTSSNQMMGGYSYSIDQY